MAVRAKFRAISETRSCYGQAEAVAYKFQATYDPDLTEDQQYSKATPTGTLDILVDNPKVKFVLGQYYYLDFTPVDA